MKPPMQPPSAVPAHVPAETAGTMPSDTLRLDVENALDTGNSTSHRNRNAVVAVLSICTILSRDEPVPVAQYPPALYTHAPKHNQRHWQHTSSQRKRAQLTQKALQEPTAHILAIHNPD